MKRAYTCFFTNYKQKLSNTKVYNRNSSRILNIIEGKGGDVLSTSMAYTSTSIGVYMVFSVLYDDKGNPTIEEDLSKLEEELNFV